MRASIPSASIAKMEQHGANNFCWRLAGGFLLVLPFLPLELIFGERRGIEGTVTPAQWLLGLASIVGISVLLNVLLSEQRATALAARFKLLAHKSLPLICFIALAIQLLLSAKQVFAYRPHLVDSVIQLFQAEIFASGMIKAPPLFAPEFFITQHMIFDSSGWYSQYPPGHPALLSIGVLLGASWLVNITLSISTALLLYLFTKRVYGSATAQVVAVLLALCPFLVFMGSSFMNHVPTLFFVSLFLISFCKWEEDSSAFWLTLSGLAMGFAFLCRPLTAIAVALPFALDSGIAAIREKRTLSLLPGVLGGSAIAVLAPIYNQLTTGDPFLPGYLKLWGAGHGLGFHTSPWGHAHTWFTGLRNELTDISLLNEFLFEWPLPSLLPLALFFMLSPRLSKWDRRLFVAFAMLPIMYFFYWHRDSFLGPRFLYTSIAFLLPLSARAISEGVILLANRKFKVPGLFRPVAWSHFGVTSLILAIVVAVSVSIPLRFKIYESSFASMKVDILEKAREQGIEEGVLFVAVSWGNRLLAALRSKGVSASLMEKAYLASDHCLLEDIRQRARRENWDSSQVTAALEELLAANHHIEKVPLNKDVTLRLRPNIPLLPKCREEIRYDQAGYTIYTPFVRANDPKLQGRFIVARDMREENSTLLQRYPEKPAYLYREGVFTPLTR